MSDPLPSRPVQTPDIERERRLDEIRREAEKRGQLQVVAEPPQGAPFPAGYARQRLLRDSAVEATTLDVGDPALLFCGRRSWCCCRNRRDC